MHRQVSLYLRLREAKPPLDGDLHPADYRTITGALKAALRAAQHDKCAFCESLITHIGYGDIEHFRTKGGFKQREEGPLQRPGYYWLAYEWENLFLSCQLCNQKFKKNLFPLSTLSNRARSHNDDLTSEDPLLLDPGIDDLDQHLRHVRGTVWAKNRSPRGRRTIEVLGLRRWELRRERLKLWQQLKATKDARDLLQKHSAKIPAGEFRETVAPLDQLLAEAILPTAPYAAMARTFLS